MNYSCNTIIWVHERGSVNWRRIKVKKTNIGIVCSKLQVESDEMEDCWCYIVVHVHSRKEVQTKELHHYNTLHHKKRKKDGSNDKKEWVRHQLTSDCDLLSGVMHWSGNGQWHIRATWVGPIIPNEGSPS